MTDIAERTTPAAASASTRPYVVISTDGHDTLYPEYAGQLGDYIEPQYRDELERWASTGGGIRFARGPIDQERPYQSFFEFFELEDEWLHGAMERYWSEPVPIADPNERIAALESKGIVGELFITITPVPDSGNGDFDRAVADAYLRWVIDYCTAVPGRIAGLIDPDYSDIEGAVAEIRWARERGLFGGIVMPNSLTSRRAGMDTPPFHDPSWEPIWRVATELDLPLVAHGGRIPDMASFPPNAGGRALFSLEAPYFMIRPIWLLMAAGVLDRYPSLKVAFIECQTGLVPGLLHDLDQQLLHYTQAATRRQFELPTASDYWYRHVAVGASFLDPWCIRDRYEVGIANIMWGCDYPHPEGSWPYVTKALRRALGGLPDDELRAILGGNAARVFGFDLTSLQDIADRVGPSVEELSNPLPDSEVPRYSTAMTFTLPKGVQP